MIEIALVTCCASILASENGGLSGGGKSGGSLCVAGMCLLQ
jgi:hypothetical protein